MAHSLPERARALVCLISRTHTHTHHTRHRHARWRGIVTAASKLGLTHAIGAVQSARGPERRCLLPAPRALEADQIRPELGWCAAISGSPTSLAASSTLLPWSGWANTATSQQWWLGPKMSDLACCLARSAAWFGDAGGGAVVGRKFATSPHQRLAPAA